MKPADFKTHPWSSITGKSEAETVARNIMIILARNGNEWRELPWDEYELERMKDHATARDMNLEIPYFSQVLPFTMSEAAAREFSPTWKRVGQNESEQ